MIRCEGLVKIYRASGVDVFALQGLDLDIAAGEMVAIIGSSGSGKSTLLNILGGLDMPSAGIARVGEWDLSNLTERKRNEYRRRVTGFLWQNTALNLTPYLTVEENVLAAMSLVARPDQAEARRLLDLVGVAHRGAGCPPELSGGEQQRVAVAVALATRPAVLLADEPTGSLDSASGHQVIEVLQQINRELGTTIVVVTHDLTMTKYVTRTVRIRDGKVAAERTRDQEELVVVDSVGRVQIPQAALKLAGIDRLAVIEVREAEVVLRRGS